MPLPKNFAKPLLIALGSLLLAGGVIYHAFEQVAIPHVHEAHETWTAIAGIALLAGGLALALRSFGK